MFGPHPRNWAYRMPREARRQALVSALSQKTKEGKLHIMDGFELKTPKTKMMAGILGKLEARTTLVIGTDQETLQRSVRNIRNTKYLDVAGLNVFDVLKYDNLLLTKQSVSKIEERLAAS